MNEQTKEPQISSIVPQQIRSPVAMTDPLKPEPEQPATEMDPETARVIMQAVVNFHESRINENTALDRIAGYSTSNIRTAVKTVAQLVLKSAGAEPEEFSESVNTEKTTQYGTLELTLSSSTVNITLSDPKNFILENEFPVTEPADSLERAAIRFADFRDGQVKYASPETFSAAVSLDEIRHMIRGVRWMCANLLSWKDPGVILPEQLDTDGIPANV
jgi:hypothetical protein